MTTAIRKGRISVTSEKVAPGTYEIKARCVKCGNVDTATAVKQGKGYLLHLPMDGTLGPSNLKSAKEIVAGVTEDRHRQVC